MSSTSAESRALGVGDVETRKPTKSTIWLSYDLGANGDYEGMNSRLVGLEIDATATRQGTSTARLAYEALFEGPVTTATGENGEERHLAVI